MKPNSEELLPCPFCGGEASIRELGTMVLDLPNDGDIFWNLKTYALCENTSCWATSRSNIQGVKDIDGKPDLKCSNAIENKEAAIKLWNTRPTPQVSKGANAFIVENKEILHREVDNAEGTGKAFARVSAIETSKVRQHLTSNKPDSELVEELRGDINILKLQRDAALSTQEGWISVETDLPEMDRNILLLTASGRMTTGYYALGREAFIPDDLSVSWDDITHWQPLPTPPQESE